MPRAPTPGHSDPSCPGHAAGLKCPCYHRRGPGGRGSGASGVSSLVVPADSPGITYGRKEKKMGWNSQSTRAVVFENVKVPKENLLGHEGEGFKFAMRGLDGGRINIATCSVGAAQGALDASFMN